MGPLKVDTETRTLVQFGFVFAEELKKDWKCRVLTRHLQALGLSPQHHKKRRRNTNKAELLTRPLLEERVMLEVAKEEMPNVN